MLQDYYCNIKRVTSRSRNCRNYSENARSMSRHLWHLASLVTLQSTDLARKDEHREDDEESTEVWNSREARQERDVTVPVSRPGALLRHPRESNPEVIREVSVGHSEKKRSLSREAAGARSTRRNPRKEKEGRKLKKRRKKKKKKKADRILPDFSCSSFSANFRRPINRKAGQEGASERGEENVRPDKSREGRTGKTRVWGSRWRTRKEEGREVSDRQAKLARPSRDLADVK